MTTPSKTTVTLKVAEVEDQRLIENSVCDGCKEAPHQDENGKKRPLRRCTRCRRVSYHNTACQRNHWPVHKNECCGGGVSKGNKNKKRQHNKVKVPSCAVDSARLSESVFNVRQCSDNRKGRGYGSFSTREYSRREAIGNHFEPLVPPVLFGNRRNTHCACCCTLILPGQHAITLSKNPVYTVKVCGAQACSTALWLVKETSTVLSALDVIQQEEIQAHTYSQAQILPSALLVCRILWSRDEVHDDVMQMQSHDVTIDTYEPQQLHLFAVSKLVHEITKQQHSTRLCAASKPIDCITNILSRIKYNAFTISDESLVNGCGDDTSSGCCHTTTSQSSSGVALAFYQKPSYRINHSCQPNALQTYQWRSGAAPALQLFACQPVRVGDEICISYMDTTTPADGHDGAGFEYRQEYLSYEYRFVCRCTRCQQESAT